MSTSLIATSNQDLSSVSHQSEVLRPQPVERCHWFIRRSNLDLMIVRLVVSAFVTSNCEGGCAFSNGRTRGRRDELSAMLWVDPDSESIMSSTAFLFSRVREVICISFDQSHQQFAMDDIRLDLFCYRKLIRASLASPFVQSRCG
jgi:hypothetical protein